MNLIPAPSDEIFLIGGLHIGINNERRVVEMMMLLLLLRLMLMSCLLVISVECRIGLYTMDVFLEW